MDFNSQYIIGEKQKSSIFEDYTTIISKEDGRHYYMYTRKYDNISEIDTLLYQHEILASSNFNFLPIIDIATFDDQHSIGYIMNQDIQGTKLSTLTEKVKGIPIELAVYIMEKMIDLTVYMHQDLFSFTYYDHGKIILDINNNLLIDFVSPSTVNYDLPLITSHKMHVLEQKSITHDINFLGKLWWDLFCGDTEKCQSYHKRRLKHCFNMSQLPFYKQKSITQFSMKLLYPYPFKKYKDCKAIKTAFSKTIFQEKTPLLREKKSQNLTVLGNNAIEQGKYIMARTYFEQAALLGNTEALNALGDLYKNGKGVKKNMIIAWYFYKKSAYNDNRNGVYNLGLMYEHGSGIPRDKIRAQALYELARELGNSNAAYT